MSVNYLEDQSWLDLFMVILPILIPLAISFYFIALEGPRPEAHVDPPHVHDAIEGLREHTEPNPDEAQEAHETTQHEHPITSANDLLTSARNLSHRLDTLDNRVHDCLNSTRMRLGRSNVGSATIHQAENQIRELEVEVEHLAQEIGRLQSQRRRDVERAPSQDTVDVPEDIDLYDGPWYTDDFGLPEAEDEEEPAEDEPELDRSSTARESDIPGSPERHLRFNLRGGQDDELERNNPTLVRTASDECREHIRKTRAEALAALQYNGKIEERARVRASFARQRASLARRYREDYYESLDSESAMRVRWQEEDERDALRD
jgi:hypothetical protein